jgi:hypothetical protein
MWNRQYGIPDPVRRVQGRCIVRRVILTTDLGSNNWRDMQSQDRIEISAPFPVL